MLSASHWLLAQARFCGRTHLPLSLNSPTPTVQVIFRYLWPDAPVFNIHFIHNNCGHGDISAITLLILSLSGCSHVNILWYTAPVDMMTFRWSHRSYQSICQQHPPYLHPQVTLIHYINKDIWQHFPYELFDYKLQNLIQKQQYRQIHRSYSSDVCLTWSLMIAFSQGYINEKWPLPNKCLQSHSKYFGPSVVMLADWLTSLAFRVAKRRANNLGR